MVDDAGRARAVDARGAEHATAIQLLAVSVDQLIDEKQCVFRTGNASLQVSQHRCRATMQLVQPVRSVDKRVPARGHGHGRNETHTPCASETVMTAWCARQPGFAFSRILYNTQCNTRYCFIRNTSWPRQEKFFFWRPAFVARILNPGHENLAMGFFWGVD